MASKKKVKKHYVEYTPELGDFICSKMEEGMNLSEIVRSNKKKLPSRTTVYKWRREHPEFHDNYDTAIQSMLYGYIDEVDTLSKTPLPHSDNWKILDSDRRARIDTLKFMASKIAPKFIKELADGPQVAIGINNGEGGDMKIQVINYATKSLQTDTLIEGNDNDNKKD